MRLAIEHTTTFRYDQPINEAYTEMRLRPLDTGGQRCIWFSLQTEPRGEVFQYADRFGNDVRHFDVLQPHQELRVTAVSRVITPDVFENDARELSPVDEYDFRSPSLYVPLSPHLVAWAAGADHGSIARETAFQMMHAVYKRLEYVQGVTDVNTTAEQVLDGGRGVCQDFAHVLIGMCRARGMAARYVSGYLYAPGEAPDHSAASHAWVDVFVPGEGWLSLDPTHDCEQSVIYVRVAVGRDYGDVSPTRGVYRGNAVETLGVQVSVRSLA